jgi:uncharacterized membrane protein
MNTLSAWIFPAEDGADAALLRLRPLAEQGLISVDDAAIAPWPASRRKPSLRELGSLAGPGALWGGFWGLVLGMIFMAPLAGPAFGAAAGAVAGSLIEFGVGDTFITGVRADVRPGTSALFVLSHATTAAAIADELREMDPRLVRSNLSEDEECHLRTTFAEEEAPAA